MRYGSRGAEPLAIDPTPTTILQNAPLSGRRVKRGGADLVHYAHLCLADLNSLDECSDNGLSRLPVAFIEARSHSFGKRAQMAHYEAQFGFTCFLLD